MEHQRAALSEVEKLQRGAHAKKSTDARLHRKLRIVQGSAANKRILSSAGQQTRPMMEKVRMLCTTHEALNPPPTCSAIPFVV